MKIIVILGLIFSTVISSASPPSASKGLQGVITTQPARIELAVSLSTDKQRYRRRDRINLEVKLTNTNAVKDTFVYGTLELGHRGSFTLFCRDAKGKEVTPRVIAEALESPPDANDTSAFARLLPFHFIGTDYKGSIAELNMERPGKYYLWVEYSSPISVADVKVNPFWGTENGTIKSNVVHIQVLP